MNIIMKNSTQNGFTLIELIVTLAVATVLGIIALPNLNTLIQNNRIASQANDLIGAMNVARSEAIKRGVQANVCAANTTQTACANGTNWANGWIVFVDQNEAGTTSTLGTLQNDDLILRVRPGLGGSNTLTSTDGTISYSPTGFADAAQNFTLCDSRGNEFGRIIGITNTGRAATTKTTTQCP